MKNFLKLALLGSAFSLSAAADFFSVANIDEAVEVNNSFSASKEVENSGKSEKIITAAATETISAAEANKQISARFSSIASLIDISSSAISEKGRNVIFQLAQIDPTKPLFQFTIKQDLIIFRCSLVIDKEKLDLGQQTFLNEGGTIDQYSSILASMNTFLQATDILIDQYEKPTNP